MLGLAKKILLANPCGKVADTLFDAADGPTRSTRGFGAGSRTPSRSNFDFSGYFGHGDRPRAHAWLRFSRKTSTSAVSRRIDHRLLAALAQSRSPPGCREYLYIPLGGKSPAASGGLTRTWSSRWLLGRASGTGAFVDLRHLGRPARRAMLGAGEKGPGWRDSTRRVPKSGAHRDPRFVVVLIGWVFFRASSLSKALTYLASMFRPAPRRRRRRTSSPASSTSRITCSRSRLAAIVVWAGRQTWDWTQRLSMPKSRGLFLPLAWLALVVPRRPGVHNPFIYFIF